jgi:hypothetical protein
MVGLPAPVTTVANLTAHLLRALSPAMKRPSLPIRKLWRNISSCIPKLISLAVVRAVEIVPALVVEEVGIQVVEAIVDVVVEDPTPINLTESLLVMVNH